MKSLDEYITKVVKNIEEDRGTTKALLMDLMKWMRHAEERHKEVGIIAAKYLETLQRSNEQLVKVTSLVQKKVGPVENLSQQDKDDLLDLIQEEGEDV
jgi:hypothetical protein